MVPSVDARTHPVECRYPITAIPRPVASLRHGAALLVIVLLFVLLAVPPLVLDTSSLELNADPDEAAHYVTSLMIRSYAADAGNTGPRQFAETYYLHYPKVAFGIWPPLFHLSLAGWMLLAGASVSSALLFVSLTAVGVALVIFGAARQFLGVPLAISTALWFATLPAVQAIASSVMLDMLCAVFMVSAAVAFGRYIDSGRSTHAMLFALLAAGGMLTKYNAIALGLLPPVAVVAARRWDLITKRNFWAIPLVVAAICAPWYVMQWDMVQYAADPIPTLNPFSTAGANLVKLVDEIGAAALLPCVLGICVSVGPRRTGHGIWCSLLGLLVSVWLFHSFVYPIVGSRYLIAALAAMVLFTAAGIHWAVVRFLAARGRNGAAGVRLAAAALALLAIATWVPPQRVARGFGTAADFLLDRGLPPDGTLLVSSDGMGEGAFIAHVAAREPQPRSIVLRGGKLLATGTWMQTTYEARYTDSAAVLQALDRARVQYVVLDDQNPRAHHVLLDRALKGSPAWALVRRVPSSRPADAPDVRVYARTRPLPPGKLQFELSTSHSLGYNLRVN